VQANFRGALSQKESVGTLMYNLQRKNTNQPNEEEATYIWFVVVWEINSSREFCVVSLLIEHDKGYFWNIDNIVKLINHYKLFNIQYGPIEEIYLIYDNVVLMTSLNVSCEAECYKLEITIFEGSINEYTQRLQYIDLVT
jgi:hypothetical protein